MKIFITAFFLFCSVSVFARQDPGKTWFPEGLTPTVVFERKENYYVFKSTVADEEEEVALKLALYSCLQSLAKSCTYSYEKGYVPKESLIKYDIGAEALPSPKIGYYWKDPHNSSQPKEKVTREYKFKAKCEIKIKKEDCLDYMRNAHEKKKKGEVWERSDDFYQQRVKTATGNKDLETDWFIEQQHGFRDETQKDLQEILDLEASNRKKEEEKIQDKIKKEEERTKEERVSKGLDIFESYCFHKKSYESAVNNIAHEQKIGKEVGFVNASLLHEKGSQKIHASEGMKNKSNEYQAKFGKHIPASECK